METSNLAVTLAGFISLLAIGGSIVGFLLSSSRLKTAIENKGREDQKLMSAVQQLMTQVSELKDGQGQINTSLIELRLTNQEEHGALTGKIRDLEMKTTLRIQKLEDRGCNPAQTQKTASSDSEEIL